MFSHDEQNLRADLESLFHYAIKRQQLDVFSGNCLNNLLIEFREVYFTFIDSSI
jgi:hypothetical protein